MHWLPNQDFCAIQFKYEMPVRDVKQVMPLQSMENSRLKIWSEEISAYRTKKKPTKLSTKIAEKAAKTQMGQRDVLVCIEKEEQVKWGMYLKMASSKGRGSEQQSKEREVTIGFGYVLWMLGLRQENEWEPMKQQSLCCKQLSTPTEAPKYFKKNDNTTKLLFCVVINE